MATYLQVVFSMDENVSVQREDADQSLRQQNDRLQLLLKLTNSITSNLELTEVLRAIAANVREVMRCDAATILLPGAEPGTFRNHAVAFPGSRGFLREEQTVTPGEDSPAKAGVRDVETGDLLEPSG